MASCVRRAARDRRQRGGLAASEPARRSRQVRSSARPGMAGDGAGGHAAARAAAARSQAVPQAEEGHRQRPGGGYLPRVFGQASGAEPRRALRCPGQHQRPRR